MYDSNPRIYRHYVCRPTESDPRNMNPQTRVLLYSCLYCAVLGVLSACGSDSSSPAATDGSENCVNIAGEPDITGPINFTPTRAQPGDTVIMHVPVDSETSFIGAELMGYDYAATGLTGPIVGNSVPTLVDGSGYITIAPLRAQIIDVPLFIPTGSGAGQYIPMIAICSGDVESCKQEEDSHGLAVNYTSVPVDGETVLWRFKYFENGAKIEPEPDNMPTASCVARPTLVIALP